MFPGINEHFPLIVDVKAWSVVHSKQHLYSEYCCKTRWFCMSVSVLSPGIFKNRKTSSTKQPCLWQNLLFASPVNWLFQPTSTHSMVNKTNRGCSSGAFTLQWNSTIYQTLQQKTQPCIFITHQLCILDPSLTNAVAEILAGDEKSRWWGVLSRSAAFLVNELFHDEPSCIILLVATNRYGCFSVEVSSLEIRFSVNHTDRRRQPAKPKYWKLRYKRP